VKKLHLECPAENQKQNLNHLRWGLTCFYEASQLDYCCQTPLAMRLGQRCQVGYWLLGWSCHEAV